MSSGVIALKDRVLGVTLYCVDNLKSAVLIGINVLKRLLKFNAYIPMIVQLPKPDYSVAGAEITV